MWVFEHHIQEDGKQKTHSHVVTFRYSLEQSFDCEWAVFATAVCSLNRRLHESLKHAPSTNFQEKVFLVPWSKIPVFVVSIFFLIELWPHCGQLHSKLFKSKVCKKNKKNKNTCGVVLVCGITQTG